MKLPSNHQLAGVLVDVATQFSPQEAIRGLEEWAMRHGQRVPRQALRLALRRLALKTHGMSIETAQPLSVSQQTNLTHLFAERLNEHQQSMTFRVNPHLLGGFRIRQGSDVFDYSVRSQIAQLTHALKGGQS